MEYTGAQVRAVRKQNNLAVREVARVYSVADSTWERFESGQTKQPSLNMRL